MAGGGYAFQKVDGVYDGTTTGVNTDGAIAGAEVLKSLFDDGVMPQGVDYGVMDGAMNNGEVAPEWSLVLGRVRSLGSELWRRTDPDGERQCFTAIPRRSGVGH